MHACIVVVFNVLRDEGQFPHDISMGCIQHTHCSVSDEFPAWDGMELSRYSRLDLCIPREADFARAIPTQRGFNI